MALLRDGDMTMRTVFKWLAVIGNFAFILFLIIIFTKQAGAKADLNEWLGVFALSCIPILNLVAIFKPPTDKSSNDSV